MPNSAVPYASTRPAAAKHSTPRRASKPGRTTAMQLLPDLENNRPLAIGLLVVALVLVYFIFFHWFVARHLEMAGQVSQLEETAARFKAAVERREPLRQRLDEPHADPPHTALF